MPHVTVYRNGIQEIFLSGIFNGDHEFVPSKLELSGLPTGNEELLFVSDGEFRIAQELLKPDGGNWKFKPVANGLILSASLTVTTVGNEAVLFGRKFNSDAGLFIKLTLRLPDTGTFQQQAYLELEVCGAVAVDGGPVAISTDPLCFKVEIDISSTDGDGDFTFSLPTLSLGFPDFGLDLPKLRLPWKLDLPFPTFPFRMAPFSFGFPDSPISIGWKSASVEFDEPNRRVIVKLSGFRVEVFGRFIEGELKLAFAAGAVLPTESTFIMTSPAIPQDLVPAYWHFDEDCLLVGWKQTQINAWLKLLVPELADEADTDEMEIALRLLRRGGDLAELRLDWKKAGTDRTINLPGFKVQFPAAEFYTLLYKPNPADENTRITFFSTLETGKQIVGKSTFTFGRKGEGDAQQREILNDSEKADELIRVTATPAKRTSVAIADISLNGKMGAPSFFKSLENEPLISLFELSGGEQSRRCTETENALTHFGKTNWKIDAAFNLPTTPGGGYKFPFLKGLDQYLQIKKASAEEADFETKTIACNLDILAKVFDLEAESQIKLSFNWERFSFDVENQEPITFRLKEGEALTTDFLGMKFEFAANPGRELFRLHIADGNYQLLQAPGSTVTAKYADITSEEKPLVFALRDFKITSAGVSVKGSVTDADVLLNGIKTKFRFDRGEFEINENRLEGFSISGSGPLPPDLVGDATARISLRFEMNNGRVELTNGSAELRGKNVLKCKSTRFEFTVDGIGLKFVKDGNYHLYFTLTGRARFVLASTDSTDGPLSWLPTVEMQMVECPLTGDASVLSKHIKFLVELPNKPKFDFLGCFKMELRGIGFVPSAEIFDGDAAMELSGQLSFSDAGGDVIETAIDFHNLYIGLPEPGSFFPRIHFKHLGVRVKVGDVFALQGEVDFIDDKQKGIEGFFGKGGLTIKGLPEITVAFSFLRIRRDTDGKILRAWFFYIQAGKLSIPTPLFRILIREVGLGFGYRYTLLSIAEAIKIDDPKLLITKLQELSHTQGELSRFDQWSPDLEEPGQSPYWTFVARALFAQTSPAASVTDWNERKEKEIPCLFVLDMVLALRSDLTFLMTGRGWLATNYNDYLTKETLRTSPLFSGFILLSPKRPRLLAHLVSNPGAEFGDHPPLPEFLKDAIRKSRFSSTLLLEPGLLHQELGWPNMLQWTDTIGPLKADFRGGLIFRLSGSEVVYGLSFLARGSLEFSGRAGGSSVGAKLSGTANVAFGARFIAVLGIQDPFGRSAIYGGVGVEISVRVSVEFWLRFKKGCFEINFERSFTFDVSFTASLEVGVTGSNAVGLRGSASVGLRIMGRGLHFRINIGLNSAAVAKSLEITNQYLNIGLEAREVEPIPGTTAQAKSLPENLQPTPLAAPLDLSPVVGVLTDIALEENLMAAPVDAEIAVAGAADAAKVKPAHFITPHYTIFSIPISKDATEGCYFLLFPNENTTGEKANDNYRKGFLPVPPDPTPVIIESDFFWDHPNSDGVTLRHFDYASDDFIPLANNRWKVNWIRKLGDYNMPNRPPDAVVDPKPDTDVTLARLIRQAFYPENTNVDSLNGNPFDAVVPNRDPALPWNAISESVEDPRVYFPSEDAFEAAVRGAAEQFEGSPNFKRDPNSIYEAHLANAFSDTTSIYAEDGTKKSDEEIKETDEVSDVEVVEHIVQLRSMIVGQMITDLQDYIQKTNARQETKQLTDTSVAFQMGLVFKTDGGIPDWIERSKKDGAGTIYQRSKVDDTGQQLENNSGRSVRPFNTKDTDFNEHPPQFQRVKQYSDANTVAITWDLQWPEGTFAKTGAAAGGGDTLYTTEQKDPEQHLLHYLVRRHSLSGNEPEREFAIKMSEALSRPTISGRMNVEVKDGRTKFTTRQKGVDKIFKDGQAVKIFVDGKPVKSNIGIEAIVTTSDQTVIVFKEEISECGVKDNVTITSKALQPLRSRFQFVDNFNDETAAEQANLPASGKLYTYTITPVDVTGTKSARPITIVATRKPNEPPLVPTDVELEVPYDLSGEVVLDDAQPAKPDDAIKVTWTEPARPADKPPVVVAEHCVIFRKEMTFPVGSYVMDGDSEGNSASGYPASNATQLRTDTVIPVKRGSGGDENKFEAAIPLSELVNRKIFDGKSWRPEAWRVFFQTKSVGGVKSSLTPVRIALSFKIPKREDSKKEFVTVTKRPELLEWITRSLTSEFLPPEDGTTEVGLATVPMPFSKDGVVGAWTERSELKDLLRYQEHPKNLRSIRFEWNQSPAGGPGHQADLHAGFKLFEFDADAHLWNTESSSSDELFNKMRLVQEFELISDETATRHPATMIASNQWEAWYPNTVRRVELHKKAVEERIVKRSKAIISPWNSARDSFLEWPDDRGLYSRDGDTATAFGVEGLLQVVGSDKLKGFRPETFADFRSGQTVRLTNIFGPDNNNVIATIESVEDSNTVLTFKSGTLKTEADPTQNPVIRFIVEALSLGDQLSPTSLVIDVPSEIDEKTETISLPSTVKAHFLPGQFVRIIGAHAPENNGIKRIKSFDAANKKLSFFSGSFIERDLCQKLDASPFTDLHPFLAKFVADLETKLGRSGEIVVNVNPPPDLQPEALEQLLSDTSPSQDPYGWNILKGMGLSATLTFRDQKTGRNLSDEQLARVYEGLKEMLDTETEYASDFKKHIFVEFLFQTAKSVRLREEQNKDADRKDLLAMIQLSLRPVAQQKFKYELFSVEGKPGDKVAFHIDPTIEPSDPNSARIDYTLIELSRDNIPFPFSGDAVVREVTVPGEGPASLLIRSTDFISVYDFDESQFTDPSELCRLLKLLVAPALDADALTAYCTASASTTTKELIAQHSPSHAPAPELLRAIADDLKEILRDAEFFSTERFQNIELSDEAKKLIAEDASGAERTYLNRLLLEHVFPKTLRRIKREVLPPTDWRTSNFNTAGWDSEEFLNRANNDEPFSQWQRFRRYLLRFNPPSAASGDAPKLEAPHFTDNANFGKVLSWLARFYDHGSDHPTDSAVMGWVASAYPRVLSPVGVTADSIGRMNYYHPVEDQWAHAYRYYFLPSGRYDALWEALRQSGKVSVKGENEKEIGGPPADQDLNAGGLDVVLDRTRDLAAPMILYSGRLDAPAAEGLPAPSRIWEVIVDKHPEQRLIERNRTLVRQLEPMQTAITFSRRFAYTDNLVALNEAVGWDIFGDLEPFDSTEIKLPDKYESSGVENKELLLLDLNRRIGGFGKDASAFHLPDMPYWHEHRFIVVAQTSGVVSPKTEVVQREFEYHSPLPTAESDGSADGKTLTVRIPLRTYLDCTPDRVAKRWIGEKTSAPEKRKVFSYPDTDVIYDIVLEYSSDIVETQLEIYFKIRNENDPSDRSGYFVRTVGSKLRLAGNPDDPVQILTPKDHEDNFVLDLKLVPADPAELRINIQPVSGRRDLGSPTVDLTHPRPETFKLLWDGVLDDSDLDALRDFERAEGGNWDNSFAQAFSDLIKALTLTGGDGRFLLSKDALIGLEQIAEITGKVTLPDPAGTKVLIWKGGYDQMELDDLTHWQERSSFQYERIGRELIDRLKGAHQFKVEFPATEGQYPKPQDIPDDLKQILSIEPGTTPELFTVSYSGLLFDGPQRAGLATLRANPNYSTSFHGALDSLKLQIEAWEIRLDAAEWLPRPSSQDLPGSLVSKLLPAKGLIGFEGWMNRSDALKLRDGQSNPANRKAVERLFNDSLARGFGNGSMKITARRGSAKLMKTNITGELD